MTWNHPALAQRALDEGDKEIAALKAEIQRLRAALTEIAEISPSTLERGDNPSFVLDIAKDALRAAHPRS